MMDVRSVRRALAASALASVLACSGLGLCWTQLMPRAHDCCERESASTSRPCSSAAVKAPAVDLLLPVAPSSFPAVERPFAALGARLAAPAPVRIAASPPLVLRI